VKEAVLVVFGLVAGAVISEIQQWRRRQEQIEDRKVADEADQRRWMRDAKRQAYAELAAAIDALEQSASAVTVLGVTKADPTQTREQALAALDQVRNATAAATAVAPAALLGQIHEFLFKGVELLALSVLPLEETPHREAQHESLRHSADTLLAAVRGDLLDLTSDQVALEVIDIARARAAARRSMKRVVDAAIDELEKRGKLNDVLPPPGGSANLSGTGLADSGAAPE
jgi:hypothetical protein